MLSCAISLVGLTAVRLGWQYRRRRSALRFRAEIAHARRGSGLPSRVGQVPSAALASPPPTVRYSARAIRRTRWRRRGAGLATAGAAARDTLVSRAGASLADLRRNWRADVPDTRPGGSQPGGRSALTQVVNSELAAARATGKVMAVLPGCGIGIGYLLGGDPARWLLAAPMGWTCLLSGVVLACAGVLWIEALARQACGEV